MRKMEKLIFYLLTIPVIAVCSVMISLLSINKPIVKQNKLVRYEKENSNDSLRDGNIFYKRVWVSMDN